MIPRGWLGTSLLIVVSALAVLAFVWPFVVDPGTVVANDQTTPFVFAGLLGLLGLSVLAEQGGGGLGAKQVALLGILAAVGAGVRILSLGAVGFQPLFVVVILAGRVLGRRLAFLSGALTLLVSAFLTSAVGPWVSFQMLATGWVALGAALLPPARGKWEVVLLTAYGFVSGITFGLMMNLWFWPFMGDSGVPGASFVAGAPVAENLRSYLVFYVLTSLGWDLPRGIGSAVLLAVGARPLLGVLRRAMRQASFDAPVSFGSPAVQDPAGSDSLPPSPVPGSRVPVGRVESG